MMNYNSLMNNLGKNGLQEVKPLNQIYDPDKHMVNRNIEDKEKVK